MEDGLIARADTHTNTHTNKEKF